MKETQYNGVVKNWIYTLSAILCACVTLQANQELMILEGLLKEAGPGQPIQEPRYTVGVMQDAEANDKARAQSGTGGTNPIRNGRIMQVPGRKSIRKKDNIMSNNNDNNKTAADKPKRSKANYDVVMGTILGHVKANPGVTLNDLDKEFGPGSKSDLKFPVIYASVRRLKDNGTIHGTGAKKNEGHYIDKAEALKNKPEPKARTPRKADSPFVLMKQTKNDKWRAIEGGSDKAPIMEAYKTASSVPGSIFKVVDNTGDEPKVIATNEKSEPAKPTKPAKAETKTKETAKA